MEATPRIELGNRGFADLGLTAWLCHQYTIYRKNGAENETRTRDPHLGKVMLYQLSYFRSSNCPHKKVATRRGLEPLTSAVTGRHSNQLNYRAILFVAFVQQHVLLYG